jgi:hypothetical protein
VIQVAGLLLSGIVAIGLWRSDDFILLLAFWMIGTVLHAGLVAVGRKQETIVAAREAFLTESAGSCALAISGLALVLSVGTVRLDLVAQRLPLLPQDGGLHAWAGAAVLLVVACRLGLPPLPWWPARISAAPPAVRVFLLGGLHPATAILLLHRLQAWMLPWQAAFALWLGGFMSFLLIMAAGGERHPARRLAWLGTGHWVGLLAAEPDSVPAAAAILAVGLILVQLHAILVRWPAAVRKAMLTVGGLALLTAAMVSGLARPAGLPGLVRLAAVLSTAWILRCWWHETARAEVLPLPLVLRRPALGSMIRLARLGQGGGPLPTLIARVIPGCGRIIADFDRIVLAGLAEGMGRVVLGTGWIVAWLDRQGQDLVYGGASRLLAFAGRTTVIVAGGHSRRLLILALLVILGLAWIGRSLG